MLMTLSTLPVPAGLAERVAALIEKNPSVMVRSIAADLGVSEEMVTAALPEEMRLRVPAEDFVPVWEAMAAWEKVTFMAETPGAILEISGQLPKGKMAHGMYNLMDKKFPLGGHVLVEKIASIWLVSKPAFGLESHSVQFFSREGAACFAVYLGRDEKRTILPQVKAGFLDLWHTYAKHNAEER